MILVKNQRERTRFIRFVIVGIIGTVVDFIVFNLLLVLGVEEHLAQALSFTVAVFSNFTWNRLWTYPDSRSKKLSRQLGQFFVVNLLGLAIRTVIFIGLENNLTAFFAQNLPGSPISPEFLGPNLALAISIGVVMFWNYFVNRYWTYNDVE